MSDNHTNTDQRNSRRWFLTGALGAGAAAVAGTALVLADSSDGGGTTAATRPAPSGPPQAASPAAGAPRAAGRPAAHAPQGYRLRPIAGDSSMGVPAAHPQVRTHAAYTLPGNARAVALTFDDGPEPTWTPRVLALLRKYQVQATFFLIGENVKAFPHLLHDIADGGHVIANHSYTHPQLTKLSRSAVRSQLGRTSDLIGKITGASPRWCRAPYGDWNAPSLKICAELGMEPLNWSIDTMDWAEPGVRKIEKAVADGIEPGAVILQHDGGGNRSQTVQAVSAYLPRLLDQGYAFVRPHL
ncbi:polysaccharide deacetylase family protein [Streptomyces sp. NPDC058045]|uniref:polysaccharide deacetylase family protein n=1 Tax=Streptomyces sp. NPDC058045 TaxID=3346311 RepID=UPI0036E33FC4